MHALLSRACLVAAALAAAAAALAAPTRAADRLDRVQLRHNPSRGTDYLPLSTPGAPAASGALSIRPVLRINLDGPPATNVFSKVQPIDVDGDGRFEFLQFNGFRMMKVWSASGRKLWQVLNPAGRVHDARTGTHRDSVAILDLDGDGGQDVVGCWAYGNQRRLVLRRGRDGRVIRSVPLPNQVSAECQVAAFRTPAYPRPIILVAEQALSRSCRRNYVGYWARTLAFDTGGRLLWGRDTCDAGHFAYGLDEDRDGRAEGIFVGRYLLDPNGNVRCTLQGWPRGDHADGVVTADIDPTRPGYEAVAVGASGLMLFQARTCRQIWRMPDRVIRNPQHVAVARLEPDRPGLQIVAEERGDVRGARTFLFDGRGRVLAVQRARVDNTMPVQNANLDGAVGSDELVGSWGGVFGRGLRQRAGTGWFWRLRGSLRETRRVPYVGSYGRWQAFPTVADLDRDGRDEIVQWGQSLIVVGKAR